MMEGDETEDAQGDVLPPMSDEGIGLVVDEARRALFGGGAESKDSSGGPTLGRYVLGRRLGAGGMGTVYEAHDATLGRRVALKVLHRDLRARRHQRMQREASALARLSHPNVVHVYEIDRLGDRTFIAMELVQGRTLEQWQRERPSWRECLRVYLQAGRGLAAAHAVGLVHRDFKPSNCIIGDDGRVRVLDFGLARAVDDLSLPSSKIVPSGPPGGSEDAQRLTETGAVLGTLAYMPPEQLGGKVADESSDQFSFCVSLYEALYGTRPFVGRTLAELTMSLMRGEPGLAPKGSRVPIRVRRVLLRGLAVEPSKRWPSMDVLLERLSRLARRDISRSMLPLGMAVAMGVGGGIALSTPQVSPCEKEDSLKDRVWNEDHRTAIRAAFARSGLPQAEDLRRRVEAQLDRYAAEWAESHAESCHDTFVTRQQSQEIHDRRVTCLQRRRNRLESAVRVLSEAAVRQELLERSVLPFQLPSIEECADSDVMMTFANLPSDSETRDRVEELRQEIDEVETLRLARDFRGGVVRAEAVVERAKELRYTPVLAEALEALGSLQSEGGSAREAQATLEASIMEAAKAGDDVTAARAWSWLIYTLMLQERLELGQSLEFAARAAVEQSGNDEIKGWLLNNLGALYGSSGNFERAQALLEDALEIKQLTLGERHVDVGISWYNLGVLLTTHGRNGEAREALARARTIFEATVGQAHPLTFQPIGGLCLIEANLGKYAEAVELCEQVLAHYEISPISQPTMGRVHFLMAKALREVGRVEDAGVEAEYALQLVRAEAPNLAHEVERWLEELEQWRARQAEDWPGM